MAAYGAAAFNRALAGGWQVRLSATGQYTSSPLVSSEQFSLTGATLVRGFDERAVVADSGVVVNAEIYTPELAGWAGIPGQWRMLGFIDAGHGSNNRADGITVPYSVNVSSVGFGTRYVWTRDFNLRL
ncbi:ShlB/FhaC/HecB family hemolysin secretion/activation protein, partial [Streptomyces sp. P5_D11]